MPLRGARQGEAPPIASHVPGKPASVLIIGSGPVVIGQAAEFDYAGTQACRALRAEGVRTILVNSQPGHDHDRPRRGRRRLPRAADGRGDRGGHRRENARGAACRASAARPALNLAMALAEAGVLERHDVRLLGHAAGGDPRWPRTARRSATCSTGSTSRTPLVHRRGRDADERAASADAALADDRPAGHHPARVHARRHRRRHRRDRGGLPGARPSRPPGQPDQPGHGRAVPRRLAGDRVRGHARRRRHVHRGLLDGERRPARRPHRRLDRRGPRPDAARTRSTSGCAARRSRSSGRSGVEGGCNVQFALSPDSHRVRGHRGQPARLALVGAGVARRPATRSPASRPRSRSAGRWPRSRTSSPGTTVAAFEPALDYVVVKLPRFPFDKFPTADRHAGQPDEGDRRGDGDRPHLRLGAEQGAPRASSRPAPGRSPRTRRGRPTFDYLAAASAGVRTPRAMRARAPAEDDAASAGSTSAARPARSTRHAQRTAAPIVLRQFLAPSDSRLWRLLGAAAPRRARRR